MQGVSTSEIIRIIAAGAPKAQGVTQAEAVRFHDDKSLYTGVYAKGGPSSVDLKITLQALTSRAGSGALSARTPTARGGSGAQSARTPSGRTPTARQSFGAAGVKSPALVSFTPPTQA